MPAAVLVVVAVASAAGPPPAEAADGRRAAYLMGTRLEVVVEAPDEGTAATAGEAALRAVEAADSRLSTWRRDSELARLNNAPPGDWVQLSPALAADLAAALHWRDRTAGAFDPGVGALVRAWGLRTGGRRPASDELQLARSASGTTHLELDGTRARRRHPGFTVEEGAFGKGAALRDAAAAALAAGASCVRLDLGGQLHRAGRCRPLDVAVAHPARRDLVVAELAVTDGSVATSGNGERSIQLDGRRLGHILDPRTGAPTAAWGSVSVLHPDPVAADCLATALYVMGPSEAFDWLAAHPSTRALLVDAREGQITINATAGLVSRLDIVDPGAGLPTPRLRVIPR